MHDHQLMGLATVFFFVFGLLALLRDMPVLALFSVVGGLYCLVWTVRYRNQLIELRRRAKEEHPSGE